MGLDMYLEARKYVSKYDYPDGWDSKKLSADYEMISQIAPEGFDEYAGFGGGNISLTIGYWRKANAIHGWFVENVQDGVDDCGSYYVPREKLVELRDACKSVLLVPAGVNPGDTISEVGLVPRSGFFFGSYDIDEWYMEDLKLTINIIDNALTLYPQGEGDWNISFYYSSSW